MSQLRRLRQLEEENRKLKQVVADLTLDVRALKDIASKSRYVAHDISSDENAARSCPRLGCTPASSAPTCAPGASEAERVH